MSQNQTATELLRECLSHLQAYSDQSALTFSLGQRVAEFLGVPFVPSAEYVPPAPPQEFEVEGSLGKVSVRPGQRFWMDDVWWEIVAKVGHGMYSPIGLGGCAVVTCKLISGEPDKRFKSLKDGLVDWCGDSLASAVISYQRRVALNRTPTTELVERVAGKAEQG
jgi:hypothetical protein